jgi:hypothetical protein
MCTVLLPPGVNPIAVNEIREYHINLQGSRGVESNSKQEILHHMAAKTKKLTPRMEKDRPTADASLSETSEE